MSKTRTNKVESPKIIRPFMLGSLYGRPLYVDLGREQVKKEEIDIISGAFSSMVKRSNWQTVDPELARKCGIRTITILDPDAY